MGDHMMHISCRLNIALYETSLAERFFAEHDRTQAPHGIAPLLEVIPLADIGVVAAGFDVTLVQGTIPIGHTLVAAWLPTKGEWQDRHQFIQGHRLRAMR